MDELKRKLDVFEENVNKLREVYKWRFDRQSILIVSANFALKNTTIDLATFHQVSEKIKEKAGAFTTLQRTQRYFITAELMVKSNEPLTMVNRLFETHELLTSYGFKKETTTYFLALLMLDETPEDSKVCLERAEQMYKQFRKQHPFIMNTTLYPFVLLLAKQQREIDQTVMAVEENYRLLESHRFKPGLELHQMSQLLVLRSQAGHVSRSIHLLEQFKTAGYRVHPEHYANISLLALTGFQQQDIDALKALVDELELRIGWRNQHTLLQKIAMQFLIHDYLPHHAGLSDEMVELSQSIIEAQHIALISAESAGAIALHHQSTF